MRVFSDVIAVLERESIPIDEVAVYSKGVLVKTNKFAPIVCRQGDTLTITYTLRFD
jgi:hypothetical protein